MRGSIGHVDQSSEEVSNKQLVAFHAALEYVTVAENGICDFGEVF